MKKIYKINMGYVFGGNLNTMPGRFLELTQPEVFPWSKVGELELSVNDAYYAYFLASQSWGNIVATNTYKNYLIGDLSQPTNHLALEHYAVGDYHRNFNRASNFLEDFAFNQVFRTLNQVSPALQFIEDKEAAGEEVFPSMTAADKETLKRQKGELYFMRALVNYTLATIWMPPYNPGGDNSGKYVPLKMSYVESQEKLRNAPLGSVQEFYDAMIADLGNAKDLLPDQNPLEGRANKYAAAILLYRVHFLMGNHSQALAECDYIINDAVDSKGYYDLSEDPIVAWTSNFGDAPAREVIWEFANQAGKAYQQAFGYMTKIGYYRANNGGRGENWKQGWQGTMAMSYYALNKIGWMDMSTKTPTAEAIADKRYKQLYYFLLAGSNRPDTDGMSKKEKLGVDTLYDSSASVTENQIWVDKYYRASPLGEFGKLPLMRLAEIYLSRAMFRLSENNDVAGATADLNVVRERAGLAPVSTVTKESIEIERIREFAGENGDRLLYLKGSRKPIDGNRLAEGGVNPVSAIDPPYSNMFAPLPLGETDYNGSYNN